ncbi:MAG: hypothetical protein FJ291_20950 [Planctomycetes bacterium]|nr:hypothetical protein [Planctomycetota bacterium]
MKLGPHAAPGPATRIVVLTPAKPVPGHRWLPSDIQLALRLRVVHDSPPVERAADPLAVRPPRMALIPPAVGRSPDTATEPLLSPAFLPRPDRPTFAADPTWDLSHQLAIARNVELARPASPFVRLAIPDPYETVALVRLRRPLPDSDPPSLAPGLPPRPTFPVKP